jgi:hypothetical protein
MFFLNQSPSRPLAYVFWHWPRPDVSIDIYEKELTAFLRSILSSKPPGLSNALSFRVEHAPWGPQGRMIYEDWYLMSDFSDLGSLNDAAVTGRAGNAHDSIKKYYMKGTGGVFRSIQGNLEIQRARYATWIEKPLVLSYPSFYEKIAKIAGHSRSDLWRRQMSLGPTPQFCLHSEESIPIADDLSPITLKFARIEI